MSKVHAFRTSKAWRTLAYRLKVEAEGTCNRCGERVLDFKNLIGHHIIELTEENVGDANISLNPENIEIICFTCHNKQHNRYCGGVIKKPKKVYIVYGSPLSGKTTLVHELIEPGDIVLDHDALYQAITFMNMHEKPNNVRFNVFKLRDELMDQIRMRYGNWYNAYVIGGYPEKYERQRLAELLGAELIYVDATREECEARATQRPKEWMKYIAEWWEKYSE